MLRIRIKNADADPGKILMRIRIHALTELWRTNSIRNLYKDSKGLYIGKYPHPGAGGEILADVIWGKKYENAKNKKGENVKEKGRKGEGNEKEEVKVSNKCKIWKN